MPIGETMYFADEKTVFLMAVLTIQELSVLGPDTSGSTNVDPVSLDSRTNHGKALL